MKRRSFLGGAFCLFIPPVFKRKHGAVTEETLDEACAKLKSDLVNEGVMPESHFIKAFCNEDIVREASQKNHLAVMCTACNTHDMNTFSKTWQVFSERGITPVEAVNKVFSKFRNEYRPA